MLRKLTKASVVPFILPIAVLVLGPAAWADAPVTVVVGQSLGANMALAYAVSRQNVAGVVMAAPGHQPAYSYRSNPAIKEAIDRAASLPQSGQRDQPFSRGWKGQVVDLMSSLISCRR